MNKSFILSLALLAFSSGAAAQNQYVNYQSMMVPCNYSAVSLVHSNESVYYFQADNMYISVMDINPYTMVPTGATYCSLLNQEFRMRGAFEDSDHNCVIYGFIPTAVASIPAFVVWNPNQNNLLLYYRLASYGAIVDGCIGYDINNQPIYMFVLDNGQLIAMGPNDQVSITPDNSEYYTDISWDNDHHLFIATGPWGNGQSYPGIIVDLFKFESSDPVLGIIAQVHHGLRYLLNNNAVINVGEHQAMHVQLDDNYLLVCRDLRVENKDILWMTRIKNFCNSNCFVEESYSYYFPTHKLLPWDMLYDPFHKRVNFLGKIVYCTLYSTKLLAQTNPYDLFLGLNVGQLDGGFAIPSSCPSMAYPNIDIYGNSLHVGNLALNIYHECVPVMIAGVSDSHAYHILTETYDITQSSCDFSLPVEETPFNPFIIPYPLTTTLNDVPFTSQSCTIGTDYEYFNIMCYGLDACPPITRDTTETKSLVSVQNNPPSIIMDASYQFVCQGFEGEITYVLYNMMGQSVASGTTYNGLQNYLPKNQGAFILKATDRTGLFVTKKVILF